MSYEPEAIKDRRQKVHFQQYLYNSNEPRDNTASDMPPALEAELLENSPRMRRHFRHIASRMRNRY